MKLDNFIPVEGNIPEKVPFEISGHGLCVHAEFYAFVLHFAYILNGSGKPKRARQSHSVKQVARVFDVVVGGHIEPVAKQSQIYSNVKLLSGSRSEEHTSDLQS